jgi:hypothetical protein
MTRNSRLTAIATVTAIASLNGIGAIAPAFSVQLANGKVFFNQVPRLHQAATTFSATSVSGATYYFELEIPSDAGEPLKQVQIQQKDGIDRVDFNLRRTRASLTKRRGPEVGIESVTRDLEDRVTITFTEAIAPGNQVVLALRPYWNPDTGGVYLFGVTALPEGELTHPQFLGYGRLHFYERNGLFGLGFGRFH